MGVIRPFLEMSKIVLYYFWGVHRDWWSIFGGVSGTLLWVDVGDWWWAGMDTLFEFALFDFIYISVQLPNNTRTWVLLKICPTFLSWLIFYFCIIVGTDYNNYFFPKWYWNVYLSYNILLSIAYETNHLGIIVKSILKFFRWN